MKKAIFLSLFALASVAHGDVWTDREGWSEEWEEKFSSWVKSPAAHKDIFVSPNSRYKGIVADCADVAYAFRAIFAYENGLKFSAKNPVATSRSSLKTFSNKMTKFDNIQDPDKRVVAFVNYLNLSLGSETLAANDSYPLELAKIRPADMFLYKVLKKGSFIRHNYNIKSVDNRGNFETIYSTQAIRDNGQPMVQRQMGFYHAPIAYKWGFRRYDYGDSVDSSKGTSFKSSMSQEQFALAKELGERGFFAHVKSKLAKEIEDPESAMKGQLKELCDQVIERIDVVEKGILHQKVLAGKCMAAEDYDTHSTPSRDGRLKDIINNLAADYKEMPVAKKGQLSGATLNLLEGLTAANPSQVSLAELIAYCPIKYKEGVQVSLRDIRMRMSKGLMSSHPNDSLELRWGEKTSGKTKCPSIY